MYVDKQRLAILACMFFILVAVWNGLAGIVVAKNTSVLQRFATISTIGLTMAEDGDHNPYRVARVKRSVGNLKEGHILVGNFNKNAEVQNKRAIIADVAPDGTVAVFSRINPETVTASCPGGIGMTTSLVVLRDGWVIVGVMPSDCEQPAGGCLVVLNEFGKAVDTFSGALINGPWDLAAYESEEETRLFVTNVLIRTTGEDGRSMREANVVRINLGTGKSRVPRIASMTIVASGFQENTGPAGFATGPTGLGLSPECDNNEYNNCDHGENRKQVLYIVDSLSNRIALIPDAINRTASAGIGVTISMGGSLNDPRGLVIAPNGHLLTANRIDGIITEINPQGQQIARVAANQYRRSWWRSQADSPES